MSEAETQRPEDDGDRPTLLVVDDDHTHCRLLRRAMEVRGYAVSVARSVDDALWQVQDNPPEYAVIDLNMPGGSGLMLVEKLHALDAGTCMVVLTGFASIATAVEAIRRGARHYLAKPASADEIVEAFSRVEGDPSTPVPQHPITLERMEWEHIQKVLLDNDGNVTAAARALKVHRRTLQRKLTRPPTAR
ncbi:MAG TPA: response regulator [Rhodocyclaceae bacterium]